MRRDCNAQAVAVSVPNASPVMGCLPARRRVSLYPTAARARPPSNAHSPLNRQPTRARAKQAQREQYAIGPANASLWPVWRTSRRSREQPCSLLKTSSPLSQGCTRCGGIQLGACSHGGAEAACEVPPSTLSHGAARRYLVSAANFSGLPTASSMRPGSINHQGGRGADTNLPPFSMRAARVEAK